MWEYIKNDNIYMWEYIKDDNSIIKGTKTKTN